MLAAETFVSQKGRRWNWNFSVGGHSEDCIGLSRTASGSCFWSEAILKTALARLEQPLRVSFCRNRNKFVRRCSSLSRIGKSSSNRKDGHSRSLWRRKEEGRPLRRLHWLASEGPCLICREAVQTVEWFGNGCGWK